jgi:hypothetical protein
MEKTTPHRSSEATEAPLPAERAFVVQFRAQTAAGADIFVGRIEHMASGEATRFGSAEDLLAFVAKMLAPMQPSPEESFNPSGPKGNVG